MTDALVDILLYPLADTLSVVEAVWALLGAAALVLAVRKWRRARAHERDRREAGVNGDRHLASRMNVRTATMAVVLATTILAAGVNAALIPPRPDEYADASAVTLLALVVLVAWFVRWLVLDWRDATVLNRRIDAALALLERERGEASRAVGAAEGRADRPEGRP